MLPISWYRYLHVATYWLISSCPCRDADYSASCGRCRASDDEGEASTWTPSSFDPLRQIRADYLK